MAVAVYHLARANAEAGIPNTYAILEDQCGLKTRQMQYVCKSLVTHGFLEIGTDGGGRGYERHFVPVKGAQKGAQKGAVDCTDNQETVHKRVHERVQSPPTPPVVVVAIKNNDPPTPLEPEPQPTYRTTLGDSWSKFRHKYAELDPVELNEPWLIQTLIAAERDVGELSERQLRQGLGSAWEVLRRKLTAERNGKETIRSVRGLAKLIVTERLKEQQQCRPSPTS